jgi:hypothetical protein
MFWTEKTIFEMDIIDLDDVPVSSKRLTNNLQLLILFTNFTNQISSFSFHAFQEFSEKHSFIINPCGLISNLSNHKTFIITNDECVFNSALVFEFVKWIFLVVSYFIHNEYFFSEDFLLVLKVIYNHDRDFVLRSSYIKRKNFFPIWIHIQWFPNLIRMFNLFIIIHNNLYHWLKRIRSKEIVIEFTINDVKIKSGSFHDFNSINVISRLSFFQQGYFGCYFSYFLVHSFNIFRQKFNVIFTIFEGFKLILDEFFDFNFSIVIDIHINV